MRTSRTTCSFLILLVERELVRLHYLDLDLIASFERLSEQPIVRGHKPASLRLLSERQMQRVEWAESETGEQTCAFLDVGRDVDGSIRHLQPESGGEAPVFTRIAVVLEPMSRRDDEG